MPTAITDLRAANDILNLMERSKIGADELFDSLPGFLLVLNGEGVVLRANRIVGREVGISSDDIPGSHLGDLLGRAFWDNFGAQFERLRSGMEPALEFECAMKSDLGAKKTFWWQITPFFQSSKRLYFAVGNDITELRRQHEHVVAMEKDLEVTRSIQELLLPPQNDLRFEGVRLVSYYQPVAQSGGDWWWCSHRADGGTEVVIGDVTGHGVTSAMVAAAVSGGYVTAREMLLGSPSTASAMQEIARLFALIEQNLKRMRDYWMTLSVVEILPRLDQIRWLSAGAPPVFIHRANGKLERHSSSTPPLASARDGADQEREPTVLPFAKGDRALVFTDGIFEFLRKDGTEFGVRRLERAFAESRKHGGPETSRQFICDTLSRESAGEMSDDGMFVLIERT